MPRPAPAAKRRSSLTPLYALLGLIVLAGAAILYRQTQKSGGEAASAPVPVVMDPAALQRLPGMSIGRPDAPITILEFADFQCPGCGQWARFMEPVIKERLVDTGRARYVFYDFPLSNHKHSFLASRAARCANEQGKFWEMHGAIFAKQSNWSFEDDAVPLFVEYARGVGVDEGKFEQCLRSDKYAQEVSQSAKLGESLGVGSTPTVFVNGQRLPSVPRSYAEFEAQLERIAGAGATGGAPAAGAPAAAATPAAP